MSWNSQFELKHPSQNVAPFLQSGMNVPYGLKIVRGYCDLDGTAAAGSDFGYYLHYLDNSSEVAILDPGSVVIGATMKARTTLTGDQTLSLMMSTIAPSPTISPTNDGQTAITVGANAISTLVTPADVILGAVLPFGAIGGNNAVSPMASATNGCWPIVQSNAGAGTHAGGRVYVTLLVMQNITA